MGTVGLLHPNLDLLLLHLYFSPNVIFFLLPCTRCRGTIGVHSGLTQVYFNLQYRLNRGFKNIYKKLFTKIVNLYLDIEAVLYKKDFNV